MNHFQDERDFHIRLPKLRVLTCWTRASATSSPTETSELSSIRADAQVVLSKLLLSTGSECCKWMRYTRVRNDKLVWVDVATASGTDDEGVKLWISDLYTSKRDILAPTRTEASKLGRTVGGLTLL